MNDLQKLGISVYWDEEPTDREIIASYRDAIWVDEKKKILNENTFARMFCDINKCIFYNGVFYTKFGKETDDTMEKCIWQSLESAGIATNVAAKAKKLKDAIRLAAIPDNEHKFKIDPNIIPFKNGIFNIAKMEFVGGRSMTYPYRLPVELPVNMSSTPNFEKWLNDLFEPEDQNTIRQFLGYCLVPNTKAQKSLFLVGEGGAGKSVIGVILEEMLGDAMLSTSNTQDFLNDKFKLPELENKLVLYDDDLDSKALEGTGFYKKLITNNVKLTVDRKYGQPFSFTPQVKLVCCCNEMLTSTYDQTDGFYRRLLPIRIKPKAPDFKPDLLFYDKIRQEVPMITLWALIGLLGLQSRNWELPESQRTKNYLAARRDLSNYYPLFMETVFDFNYPEGRVLMNELDDLHEAWCRDNSFTATSFNRLKKWLLDNAEKYNITYQKAIRKDNKVTTGYAGLKIKDTWILPSGNIRL
jgi:putative DNA primase/helicase